MTELTILDELKTLLPPLSEKEYDGLEKDILERGCVSPIVTWNDAIVDGHNRYEICQKHGIPFEVNRQEFATLDDAKIWAWMQQENRRNLTSFQRTEIAKQFKPLLTAKAKARMSDGGSKKSQSASNQGLQVLATLTSESEESDIQADTSPVNEGINVRKELAKIADVSEETMRKSEFIQEHADEDTKEKLRQDKTTINKEYNRLKGGKKSRTTKSKSTVVDSEPTPESTKQDATTTPSTGAQAGFAPGSPEEEKYSAKTTLKPIPRNRPDVLVRNLLTHFPKEFVPNMIRVTFQILVEIGEKDQAKALALEVYKQFGRK